MCIFTAFSFLTHYYSWKIFAGWWEESCPTGNGFYLFPSTRIKCPVPSKLARVPKCKAQWVHSLVDLGVPGAEPACQSTHSPFPLWRPASEAPEVPANPKFQCKNSPDKIILYGGPCWAIQGEKRHVCSQDCLLPLFQSFCVPVGTHSLIFIPSSLSQNPLDCNLERKTKVLENLSLIRKKSHILTMLRWLWGDRIWTGRRHSLFNDTWHGVRGPPHTGKS